ncbi:glycosyltransferase family 4 protein [Rahnella sp. SAP-1]|uniref:Glycosyltransferase family 4 protein n=1 Tax=Rouxiella aceris TaxID=2703884 RepID=A0A848ML44_9GAMM|nr:glycosyltransferase family 4 protein [Rouxiella aceris]NMP27993.1 glycosyltransferase family 4 protein [Rouxiella aceris]
MYKKNQINSRISWLTEQKDPSVSVFFEIPKAIQFLISIDAEARNFYPLNKENRILAFFWWAKIKDKNKEASSVEWHLNYKEQDYLKTLSLDSWKTEFKKSLHQYLQIKSELIPVIDNNMEAIFPPVSFGDGDFSIAVPGELYFLVECREDLRRAFDLTKFSGLYAMIQWWKSDGASLYVKLSFCPEEILNKLHSKIVINEYNSLPLFSYLILSEREDLRNIFDLRTITGLIGFIEWWNLHGQMSYPLLKWSGHELIDSLNEIIFYGSGLRLPRFISLLLLERNDLHFDIRTLSGITGLIKWWNHYGKFNYPQLGWNTEATISELNEFADVGEGFKLPRFILLVLEERKDIREAFDLKKVAGLDGFLGWWQLYGKVDYPQFYFDTELAMAYKQEMVTLPVGISLPRFLLELQQQLPELTSSIDISDVASILALISWWQEYGFKKIQCFDAYLDLNSLRLFATVLKNGRKIPLILDAIFESRKDLQAIFKNEDVVNYKELVAWWNMHGRFEYSILGNALLEITAENNVDITLSTISHKPLGINIVGFPQGTLGLGEDARLAGQVIESLGLDGVYINAPIPGPAKTVMPEGKLPIVKNCRFSTTLFCLPPTEMIRLAIEGGQHLIDNDEYKIGAWPWELPHWPASFARVRDFVDEIWAQSEYVKDCFLKEGHTPVHKMPMAVTIPQPDADLREQLGITDNSFVYYLMFDGNSWLSRKNPIAGVLAFQQAFAASSEYQNVRLLIKAMNINANDPMWQKIVHMANQDSRIIIITERMDRQTLINMMNACDCYISLHRSEGFGRVIAEAMLLGQPVVATNFSGNVDFCKKDTAFLVDGDLLPLQQGDYIFFEGQYWCDPDIDTAAMQLLKIYEDNSLRQEVALSGQSLIQRNYSVSAVAAFYSERFQEISKYNGYKP